MKMDTETRSFLMLKLVDQLGSLRTKTLIEQFGSAKAILKADRDELLRIPGLGDKVVSGIRGITNSQNIEIEENLIRDHGVGLIRLGTPAYPEPLSKIHDPPYLLYVKGSLAPEDCKAIGIVGSRHCTRYGRNMAEQLAGDLVRAGYTVISGLARGIDGCAHRGALAAGGRTIAVLAGGLGRIYPPEHADLASEIIDAGALVSETAMMKPPMAGMFPARNRIISGLSLGTIVVEAATRSGALITATHAAEQGREVFAVPGQADSKASGGTLSLIKKGAVLVRNADDVLAELGELPATVGGAEESRTTPVPPNLDLSKVQIDILTEIDKCACHIDELVDRMGISVTSAGSALMILEMNKLIRRLPGNRYERI